MASKVEKQRLESKGKRDRQGINMERRKKHDQTVKRATAANISAGRMGQVRLAALPSMDDEDKTWPHRDGYKNINVGPGSRGDYKQLMPCNLGPIPLRFKSDKTSADVKNVENIWEFSKVFPKDIGTNEKPIPEWFAARLKGWADPKGHRRAKKKLSDDIKPVFFWWGKDEKLGFLEARARIFCRVYDSMAVRTLAYRKLVELLKAGINVQILGLNAYDYVEEERSLYECIMDPNRAFGHEFVLAGLLTGNRPWRQNYSIETPRDDLPVVSPAKLLDPIPPPTNKRKSSSSSSSTTTTIKKQPSQPLLPNGDSGGTGSSSSSSKHKPLTPHERNVLAATAMNIPGILDDIFPRSTTTTQIVEANGKIDRASLPPLQKRARQHEVPLFVIMNADQAGQIPDHTKFFLSLEDATDELHRDEAPNGKPRAMMIWRCGDRKH